MTARRTLHKTGSDQHLSLREKLRAHYRGTAPKRRRSPVFVRCWFVCEIVSILYVSLVYILPFNYRTYDPWTLYYVKCLLCFLIYNISANWLCLIAYKPFLYKSEDRPFAVPNEPHPEPDQEQFISRLPDPENGLVDPCCNRSNGHTGVDKFGSSQKLEVGQYRNGASLSNHNNGVIDHTVVLDINGVRDVNHARDVNGVQLTSFTSNEANNNNTHGKTENNGHEYLLSWKHCHHCDVTAPPRAFHCNVCQKCVLKRDHHCYLTGICVGFTNQRYFIVMCFYGVVISTWCLYESVVYITNNPVSDALNWWDIFLPITAWKTMFDSTPIRLLMLIQNMYLLGFISVASTLYFLMQIILILINKTPHEFLKKIPIRSTTSIWRNFRSVFGHYWLLNFIFPAQILFRQSDDGFHWEMFKPINGKRVESVEM